MPLWFVQYRAPGSTQTVTDPIAFQCDEVTPEKVCDAYARRYPGRTIYAAKTTQELFRTQ